MTHPHDPPPPPVTPPPMGWTVGFGWLLIVGLTVGAGWLGVAFAKLLFDRPAPDPAAAWEVYDDDLYWVRCYRHKDATNIVCIERAVDEDGLPVPPPSALTTTRQP